MKHILMCCWLLLSSAIACSAEIEHLQPNANLKLSDVLEKTLKHSPLQQVLNARAISVEAKQIHAAGMLPGTTAISLRHQNDLIGSGRNQREWEAALEIPVWMPGQRTARENVAHEASDSLEASRKSLMIGLAGQVRDAVWDVAMNNNSVELADQRLKAAQALQKDVELRWKGGEMARTDVMMAQNETLLAQTSLLRAQAELKHAEHRYWVLTGLTELPTQVEEKHAPLTTIENDHPLLAESQAKVLLAKSERNLVNVEKRENPQVVINARDERGAFDGDYNKSVGLAIRIPLDSQTKSAPLMASAELDLAQAMSEHDQRLLQLQTAFHEAEHNLEVTQAELAIVEEQHRLAQENLRLAKKAFSLGESDLISLLRAQAMAQDAQRSLLSRQTQLKWDIARYNQAVGVLP